MRIAFFVHHLKGTDGWSRYAVDLGQALVARGHEMVALVQEETDAPWCKQYPLLRSPLRYLNPLACLLDTFNIRRKLRELKPDIVHIIAEPYGLLLPFIGKGRRKTCMTIHGSYALIPLANGGFARWAAKKSYQWSDRVFSVSDFTKKALKQQEPGLFMQADLERKIHVLCNAIQLPPQTSASAPSTAMKRMLSVGAVKARKGHLQSIAACAAFKKYNVPFVYDIVGALEDTAYVEHVQRRIKQLGLERNIFLHGAVSQTRLNEMYLATDLFMLLAIQDGPYFEGFVLAFLEANARGKPVIGSTTGGCPEAINDGVSGFICDPHQPEQVAKRMKEMLAEHAIKPEDCLSWAKEHSIEQAAKTLEQEYLNLKAD